MPVVQTTSLDAMGSEASWRFEIELKFIMVLWASQEGLFSQES